MRGTLIGASACLVLCLILLPAGLPAVAQERPMEGEWVGSFGCEGKLTYFRMSVGATQVALHIHDETMLYEARSVVETSFEAALVPPEAPPVNLFPTDFSAMLILPDDLLTGTLRGLAGMDVSCSHFVMVRFVEWPDPASASGMLLTPALLPVNGS